MKRSGTAHTVAWRRCAVVAATLLLPALHSIAAGLPFERVGDVPLGGKPTRLDYASVDPGRRLLFIAHLGDSEVIAFDLDDQKVVKTIADVAHVHGVLAIPDLGKVYASATGSNEVVAIDAASLTISARMPGGVYPDGMAYAPEAHKLYVSDETGQTDTVIDVRSNQRIATIPLGGDVGNTQYDPVSGHIFANVQTRAELVEIDPQSDRIVARIALPGARGNHGLEIQSHPHRAFVACEGNSRLLVLNLDNRKIESSFDVGEGPDVLAADVGLGLLYVAAESGVVSLFHISAGAVAKAAEGFLGPDAHVVAVDPPTHRVFFPLKNVSGRTVLRIVKPTS